MTVPLQASQDPLVIRQGTGTGELLIAAAEFVSAIFPIVGLRSITIFSFSDQNSDGADGIRLEQADQDDDFVLPAPAPIVTSTFTTVADTAFTTEVTPLHGRFARVRYLNGATPQTIWRFVLKGFPIT